MGDKRVIRGNADMTSSEIDAETYLELDDDCLAGLVRGVAADYSEALDSVEDEWRSIAFASGVIHLLALAERVNADKVVKELGGVTRDGEDVGDWRVVVERTRVPTDPATERERDENG